MKLAHLILAHNHPMQLERLVKRLQHKDADIYIHLDSKADIATYESIKKLPNTVFITNRINVMWGEYSVIKATLVAMEQILATGINYSHINLLSGNDYPLKSNDDIHGFFTSNVGKSFIWYDLIFDVWHHGQFRVNTYFLGYYNFRGRYRLTKVLNKIMPKRKLPNNLIPYGRSQWMTITPEAAAYTLNYIKNHFAADHFFKMTWAVDEIFFQTILCNSPLLDTLVNDSLRYIRLTPEFSPFVFTLAEGEELLSSGKFYARKFDMNKDSAIFDYLDSHTMSK